MRLLAALCLSTALAAPAFAATPEGVTQHYADMALATYQDSLTTAQALQQAICCRTFCKCGVLRAKTQEAFAIARVIELACRRMPFHPQNKGSRSAPCMRKPGI